MGDRKGGSLITRALTFSLISFLKAFQNLSKLVLRKQKALWQTIPATEHWSSLPYLYSHRNSCRDFTGLYMAAGPRTGQPCSSCLQEGARTAWARGRARGSATAVMGDLHSWQYHFLPRSEKALRTAPWWSIWQERKWSLEYPPLVYAVRSKKFPVRLRAQCSASKGLRPVTITLSWAKEEPANWGCFVELSTETKGK